MKSYKTLISIFFTILLSLGCSDSVGDQLEKDLTISEMKKNLKARDKMDSERKESPLRPANDALLIDTTKIGIKEVVETIIAAADKN